LQGSCLTAQDAYAVVMEQRKLAKLSGEAAVLQEQQNQLNVDAKVAPMGGSAGGGGAVDRKGQITESSTPDDIRATQAKIRAGDFG